MKYEASRALSKKNRPAFYCFNLVTIADTKFHLYEIDKGDVTQPDGKPLSFIYDYIIDAKEVCSRITFVEKKGLNEYISALNSMYEILVSSSASYVEGFRKNGINDFGKNKILTHEFVSATSFVFCLNASLYKSFDRKNYRLSIEDDLLYVGHPDFTSQDLQAFNSVSEVRQKVQAVLFDVYRYSGAFAFRTVDFDEF